MTNHLIFLAETTPAVTWMMIRAAMEDEDITMKIVETIKESPFGNTYGGLSLALGDDGKKYLVMDDCFGPVYHGPLTDEQVAAFYLLCDVRLA